MKFKNILIVTVLLIANAVCLESLADNDNRRAVELEAEVDKEEINIGDRIKLNVRAENKKAELVFPEVHKKLGEFSVLESYPLKAGWPKSKSVGQTFILSIYTTGTHVIPPVKAKYRMPHEDEWHEAESPQVPIEVRSLLTGSDEDIKDLKGLAAFGGNMFWLVVIIALGVAVAGILWFLRKGKRTYLFGGPAKEKLPHEAAYEELKKLKAMDLPGKGQVKEYYVRLSDIARHYLEGRFSYRAPEMTTEEFLNAIKKSGELKEEHKDLLKDFLFHCDMVKFAKYGPTPFEILDSFKAAERLVDQTRPEEKPEEEGAKR